MGIKKTAQKKTSKKTARRKGMVDALFSSTQQRVLGLMYGQPDRKFFATELIGLIGAGSGAVQRELVRLTDSGLVTQELVGKQKYYKANHQAPIFVELRQIILKTVGLADPIRAALSKIKEHIGLALVFGSIAKGSDSANSDIDLLIVADDLTLQELYELLSPIENKLARRISPTLYTKHEFQERSQAKNPFVKKVLEGDYIYLMGDENVVGEIRKAR